MTNQLSPDDRHALRLLRIAVAEALERKHRLGQYAVIWRDGQVVRLEGDALADAAALARSSDAD